MKSKANFASNIPHSLQFDSLHAELQQIDGHSILGTVVEVRGPVIQAALSGAAIGQFVEVELTNNSALSAKESKLRCQLVGFSKDISILTPLGSTLGLRPGAKVKVCNSTASIKLTPELLGCVVDGNGKVLERVADSLNTDLFPSYYSSLEWPAPEALKRKPIQQTFETGLRAIDAFVPIGCGQRLCILAEPGVGKSSLLAAIASNSKLSVNVIGLIGERGREVREFIYESLTPEVRQRTVVIVSTSDDPAALRVNAALCATRVAEYFRDQGCDVLLQIDSLTRLLRAYREVGLSAGEVPVRQGYPPSVFQHLPTLIERTGTSDKGSITALYTVLSSTALDEDPMIEEIKGLTDGHLVLSRKLAEAGHFPAIDVLASLSRLQTKLQSSETLSMATGIRKLLARLRDDKELALLGAEADSELRLAMSLETSIYNFLRQSPGEVSSLERTLTQLSELARAVTV